MWKRLINKRFKDESKLHVINRRYYTKGKHWERNIGCSARISVLLFSKQSFWKTTSVFFEPFNTLWIFLFEVFWRNQYINPTVCSDILLIKFCQGNWWVLYSLDEFGKLNLCFMYKWYEWKAFHYCFRIKNNIVVWRSCQFKCLPQVISTINIVIVLIVFILMTCSTRGYIT